MHPRTQNPGLRQGAIAVLAVLAAAVTSAAAAAPAHAQFGTATVTGTVTGPGGAIAGATVTATPFGGGPVAATATTRLDGGYTMVPLNAGDYTIHFVAAGYVGEYYNDAPDPSTATRVTAPPFAVTPDVDAVLAPEATISGTVRDWNNQPREGVCVSATPVGGGVAPPGVITGADGAYTLLNLSAGGYSIEFNACDSPNNLLTEWWNDKSSAAAADPVTVTAGESQTGIDAVLGAGGSISGTLLRASGQPAAGGRVNVYTASGTLVETRTAAGNGSYNVDQLPTGSYKVEFLAPVGSLDLSEYYDDQATIGPATPVSVTAGLDTPSINAQLAGDTTPPALTIDSGPSGPTNQPAPTFGFTTESDATVQCSIDGGTPSYGPCSGAASHTPASPLADGAHTFRVQASDPSGNLSTATRDFLVDTQAPSISVSGGPSGPTGQTSPTFTFNSPYDEYTEAAPTYECAVDPAAAAVPSYGPCTTPSSHTSPPLADGDYVFRVRATDAATNSAVAQRSFTVQVAGPSLQITAGPNGATADATPSFDFSASQNATVECAVDPAAAAPSFGSCSSSSSHTAPSLADGDYVFRVRATDDSSHTTNAQRSFTVDTTAPVLTITGGPSGPSADPTPSFDFTSDGGTLECAVDPAGASVPSFGACSGAGSHTPAALADGSYVFRVRATDAAGNATTAQRSFSIDTGIQVTITSGPSGPTNATRPTFGFTTEAGAVLECSIDSGTPAYGSCSGAAGHQPPSALANGAYTFHVRASDGAGNSAVAQRSFSVDTTPPSLSITGGPAAETTNPTPTFTFNAEAGATLACSIDTGTAAFGPCSSGSSHSQASPLAKGSYVFRVRATDAAGNVANATRSFEIESAPPPDEPPPPADTAAPQVTITGGPSGKTKDTTPTFSFKADESSADFSCKVDGAGPAPCSSPATLKKLKPGKHTLSVTATDRAGNTSAPATRSFTVKKKKKKKRK